MLRAEQLPVRLLGIAKPQRVAPGRMSRGEKAARNLRAHGHQQQCFLFAPAGGSGNHIGRIGRGWLLVHAVAHGCQKARGAIAAQAESGAGAARLEFPEARERRKLPVAAALLQPHANDAGGSSNAFRRIVTGCRSGLGAGQSLRDIGAQHGGRGAGSGQRGIRLARLGHARHALTHGLHELLLAGGPLVKAGQAFVIGQQGAGLPGGGLLNFGLRIFGQWRGKGRGRGGWRRGRACLGGGQQGQGQGPQGKSGHGA